MNKLDIACQAHDACYDTSNLSVGSNFNALLPASQQHLLQTCNQNLCNAASKSRPFGMRDQVHAEHLTVPSAPGILLTVRAAKPEKQRKTRRCWRDPG